MLCVLVPRFSTTPRSHQGSLCFPSACFYCLFLGLFLAAVRPWPAETATDRLRAPPQARSGMRLSATGYTWQASASRSASGGATSNSSALSNGSSRIDRGSARCAATANMPVRRRRPHFRGGQAAEKIRQSVRPPQPPAPPGDTYTGGQQLRVRVLAFPTCRICRRFALHMVRAGPRCAVPANWADKSHVRQPPARLARHPRSRHSDNAWAYGAAGGATAWATRHACSPRACGTPGRWEAR